MEHTNNSLNIIYICTAEKGPSGGAKIIYNHSDHINKLNIANVSSEVLHIEKKKISKWNTSLKKAFSLSITNYSGWHAEDISCSKNFRSNWFKNNIRIKKNLIFDKEKDFVIFPEIFSHFAKKLCINKKIPYAIFALNGYTLKPTDDYKSLEDSYKNAKFILSVSKDISNCVKLAFPNCRNKIIKSGVAIDKKKINLNKKKTNTITYMTRKLPQHSELVLFFLRKHLPKSWKLEKIHNFKEHKVFHYMRKSKIFLSFAHFEGLGMPPIEAALAGNKIIGYTGEGGKEIWKKPIFTEIKNGNILGFVGEILKNLKMKHNLKKTTIQRKKLINKFSINHEKKNLIKMINKIKSKK